MLLLSCTTTYNFEKYSGSVSAEFTPGHNGKGDGRARGAEGEKTLWEVDDATVEVEVGED